VSAVVLLSALNGLVITAGGNPHPLSPRFIREKVSALGALGWHLVTHHPWESCEPTEGLVVGAARKHALPSDFVLAMARAESGLASHRISRAGAMGVMQLMPATAAGYGAADPFDPVQNVDAATRYLAWLWRRYRGDRVRVAAAYNAGPGVVARAGPLRLPGETRDYVLKVAGRRVR
jgi:soluble lytic murein transglycosylase-like protein